jgi:hypothetical protein
MVWLCLFSLGFGFVEAAVVVYLRALRRKPLVDTRF